MASSLAMKEAAVPGVGNELVVVTAGERPDLWEEATTTFDDVWPEYNGHGDVSGRYFGALVPRFAHLQVLVWDEGTERVVARGRTIPFTWDGNPRRPSCRHRRPGSSRPGRAGPTNRALGARGRSGHRPAGTRDQQRRHRRHGRRGTQSWVGAARGPGATELEGPLPLIPIEDYATWVREDGLPFDPWMRVHVRLGGELLRPEPHSMQITGSVAEWQSWTGMEFPADGQYVFPRGLAPLDVRDGVGHYWEPNVWILHHILG